MDKSALRKRLDTYYDNMVQNGLPVEEQIDQLQTRMLNLFYMVDEELKKLQPPTTESPTTVNPSAAGYKVDVITPMTPLSSPSAPVATPSGLAAPTSWCAHSPNKLLGSAEYLTCENCHALTYNDKILVPVAATTSSTSAKPDSSESAAPF